jgi:hypothetical protein
MLSQMLLVVGGHALSDDSPPWVSTARLHDSLRLSISLAAWPTRLVLKSNSFEPAANKSCGVAQLVQGITGSGSWSKCKKCDVTTD